MLVFKKTNPLLGNIEAQFNFASDLTEKSGGTSATLTRAGTGYYQPSFPKSDSETTNVARFEQGELLIESASTNYCLYNEDFSNVAWTNVNVTDAADSSITDPEGGTDAWRLTATATGAAYVAQVLGTNCRAMSVWLKKGNVDNVSVSLYASGTETAADGLLNVTLTDEWQRVVVDRKAACNVLGIFVHSNQIAGSATAGDYVHVYMPGAYNSGASTDIPTVGSGVTRPTDAASIPAAYTPSTFTTTFGVAMDVTVLTDTGGTNYIFSIGNTLGTSIRLLNAADDRFRMVYGTTIAGDSPGALVYGRKYRVCITANGTSFKMFIDGVKIAEDTIAGTAGVITVTNINPNSDGYFRLSNYIKYDNYISDSEAKYA